VADNQRIDDLRRRVHKDPASIAFAQLAEECRRAGQFEEAVDVCRGGLKLHPGYLSARVTLGRALVELNDLDTALDELTTVLKSAPENLAAIRGVAEIHHRRKDLVAALEQYRAALALARNDPDLQRTVDELAREIEPPPPPPHADGLSFEQMHEIFKFDQGAPAGDARASVEAAKAEIATAAAAKEEVATAEAEPAPPPPVALADTPAASIGWMGDPSPPIALVDSPSAPTTLADTPPGLIESSTTAVPSPAPMTLADTPSASSPVADAPSVPITPFDVSSVPSMSQDAASVSVSGVAEAPAALQITALERFLDAIHGARAQRGA
jgi:hypothetical protein